MKGSEPFNKGLKGWTIGTKAGFQKGHPLFSNSLEEWRENGGKVWNKGIKTINFKEGGYQN